MKLISLSIQNFGKLHHYDLTLEGGLNTVCQENGWGKTTLAAFLKAMFYGLPKSGKKDLDENDYKHYEPWQGGVFGGNLVFSCKQGTFRVERSFGENGTFALYDLASGLPSHAFSESLGNDLFGIDAEGFEQSVFLSTRALKAKDGNDSVRAKLTGIDEIHDISNYEDAYKLLDDRAKDYKRRGGAGYIGETTAKIQQMKDALSEARGKLDQQKRIEHDLADVRAQLAETKTREEELQKAILRAKQVEELRAYESKSNEFSRQKTEIERRFDGDIPTREDLAACRRMIERMDIDRSDLASTGLNQEEQAELVALSGHFPTGAPDTEVLKEKLDLATTLRAEQASTEQSFQLAQADLQNAEGRLNDLPSAGKSEQFKRLLESKKTIAKAAKKPLLTVFFVAALLLMPAGAVALILGQDRPLFLFGGIAALGAGSLFLLLHILLTLRQKRAGDAEQARLNAEITRALQQFGMPKNQDPRAWLALLEEQRKTAEAAYAAALSKCEGLSKAQQQYQKETAALRSYLASFDVTDQDPVKGVFHLHALSAKWQALLEKQKSAKQTEEQKKAALSSALAKVETFLARCSGNDFGTQKDRLTAMEELLSTRETLARMIAERQGELQEKCASLGIANPAFLEHEPDPASLSARQKELDEIVAKAKEDETRLAAQLAKWNAETEQIPEWEEELDRQTELLEDQKNRYNLLCKTRDLLAKAHEDLTTRYLEPTRQHFAKYLALLCGKNVPKATLDAKFNVTILDSGLSRQVESYSRGWRDLLQFCVRLSLIDALYGSGEETPFLLLDDPFTNLDEERLTAAKALLSNLAESRQILYLVCHEGRA